MNSFVGFGAISKNLEYDLFDAVSKLVRHFHNYIEVWKHRLKCQTFKAKLSQSGELVCYE